MKAFVTAARAQKVEENEDEAIVFKHDEREVKFYQPSIGQQAIMMQLASSDMSPGNSGKTGPAADFIALFFEMMDTDTQKYFKSRLLDRHDTFDIDGEGGMLEIFEELMEEWSARPTKSASGSRASRSKTGKQSTAPTRAKASTSSRSRSTASSR